MAVESRSIGQTHRHPEKVKLAGCMSNTCWTIRNQVSWKFFLAVQAIYQNTIDYDTYPAFNPPIPDLYVLENHYRVHDIDLWDYSIDEESSDWELSCQITSISDSRCGVVLDDHWVDIFPQPNWLGSCDITVEVIDGIKSASDTFRVTVVPVRGRVYLPVVMRHP